MNNEIDEIIKNTKYPLLMISNILNNNNISDKNKFIVIKSFFKYHILLGIECNLLDINNLSPLVYNFIGDIYYIISKQLSILPNIVKFQKAYRNNIFWKLDILKMIEYLNNMHTLFLGLFDGSKGSLYFHIKLKGVVSPLGHNYHIEEMLSRLKKTHSMFKMSFFSEYKIILLSYYQFMDLTFENMIKYTEYIFTKINNIINHTINYFILYNNYRQQLHNILYTESNIDIDINDVNSDIDLDDLPFMMNI